MIKRIIFSFVIFILFALFPWWVGVGMVFIGILLFDFYVEAIVFGIALDALFGTSTSFFDRSYVLTLLTAFLLICGILVKQRFRPRSLQPYGY